MKMTGRIIASSVIFVFLIFALTSCLKLKHTDISSSEEAKSIIGDEYEAVGRMTLNGIREYRLTGNPNLAPIHAIIKANAGASGPEVEFSKYVPKGTKITVTGLIRVGEIPFIDCRRALMVELEGMDVPGDVPVHIHITMDNKGVDCLTLNENYFRKIK